MRRSKGKKGVSVSFSLEMNLTVTKEVFLNDSKNKQRFVTFLGEELQKNGCSVFFDQGDADVQIVKKALEIAKEVDTVLIGDDTDLFLCFTMMSHAKICSLHQNQRKTPRAECGISSK